MQQKVHLNIQPKSEPKHEPIIAEFCGKVNYVNRKNKKFFSIYAEKMKKKFRCVLDYDNPFLPLKEGDAVYGIGEYQKDSRFGDTLKLSQAPFVVIGEDKNTIIKSVSIGSRISIINASSLVELMIEKEGSLEQALNYLDKLSSYFNYHHETDVDILLMYTSIISKTKMFNLLEWWYKNRNLRRLYLLSLNNTEIKKCKLSPEKIYEKCLENPYALYGIPLDKCDEIMYRLGKEIDKNIRSCGNVVRTLGEYTDVRGWTGIPSNMLVKMHPEVSSLISILKKDFNVKTEMHTVYLDYTYQVEIGVAEKIKNLISDDTFPHALDKSEIKYTRDDLSEEQKTVIQKALSENICIIRGLAGSGKSTIIKEIVYNLDKNGIKYRVVSFTGKAVSRIREVIEQKDPMTMHMSITLSDKKDTPFDHLIIDETSMVTTELFYDFLQKFDHDYRITLIGDPNQLKPISWGSLFDQLIKSKIVPTYTLSKSYRTNGLNGILLNSNHIVECSDPSYNGPPFQFEETSDFNIVDGDIDTVKNLIKVLRNNGIPSEKITVLSPYNRYLFDINKICSEIYNDGFRSTMDNRDVKWSIKDRVMMTENNYKINIMNGEEGIVTDLTEKEIKISFKDGTDHVFSLSSLDPEDHREKILSTKNLIHSFGVSVHRYQGSETDYVIFYIPKSNPNKFLNKNLLYTGITRARKMIWMVGDYDTMLRAATTEPPYRCDNLSLRLME
uniref:RecD helicase /ATP-dependent exoDNAse n=1 Tax=Pithovirus LCPAC302 TaxID=2506593 RepID=A0A481ZA31_9VIRU|nr:MAG: RecD helicase /ATP-dependent exoDNAse [Pithovirus LCPAC302]